MQVKHYTGIRKKSSPPANGMCQARLHIISHYDAEGLYLAPTPEASWHTPSQRLWAERLCQYEIFFKKNTDTDAITLTSHVREIWGAFVKCTVQHFEIEDYGSCLRVRISSNPITSWGMRFKIMGHAWELESTQTQSPVEEWDSRLWIMSVS